MLSKRGSWRRWARPAWPRRTARAAACSRAGRRPGDGAGSRRCRRARRLGGAATRIADPVLTHLAAGTLKRSMPVEQAAGANRVPVTHLEALGTPARRPGAVAGAAGRRHRRGPRPCARSSIARGARLRRRSTGLARRAELHRVAASRWSTRRSWRTRSCARRPPWATPSIRRRAPGSSPRSTSTRVITPAFSNWPLFTAMVEAGLARLGAQWDRTRVDYALRQHEQVGRRRPLRRRPRLPLGLLQQLRHPADAARRPRRRRPRTAGTSPRGRRCGRRCWTGPATCRGAGAPHRPGRHVPGDRPYCVSGRRLSAPGAGRAPARAARGRRPGPGPGPRCRPC